MGVVTLARNVSALLSAVALLSASVLPVTVSACPAQDTQAHSCCCCGLKPEQADRPCHCPKPAGSLPGDACFVQKAAPSATLPSATALDTTPLLFALPPVVELKVGYSAAPPPTPRIEPGWDPGNQGFVLPLRL